MDWLLTAECPLVVLVLKGLDQVRSKDEASVLALLELLTSIARWHLLFGRRLICFIETDDVELDGRTPTALDHALIPPPK
jgi:hypothetical protein